MFAGPMAWKLARTAVAYIDRIRWLLARLESALDDDEEPAPVEPDRA
ncbi:MAG: hypothetical protein GY926_01650 [bacterium]|nr:hypothetical protein [bacterium]